MSGKHVVVHTGQVCMARAYVAILSVELKIRNLPLPISPVSRTERPPLNPSSSSVKARHIGQYPPTLLIGAMHGKITSRFRKRAARLLPIPSLKRGRQNMMLLVLFASDSPLPMLMVSIVGLSALSVVILVLLSIMLRPDDSSRKIRGTRKVIKKVKQFFSPFSPPLCLSLSLSLSPSLFFPFSLSLSISAVTIVKFLSLVQDNGI